MPLPKEQEYTVDYIYSLPDGVRAELIDGQIYDMSPPTWNHQNILNYINNCTYNYINEKKGHCKIGIAPFAVFLNKDDKTYVEPDLSIICDEDKLTAKGCFGAPDWIVDPLKSRVTVYRFESEDTEEYSFEDTVKVGIYDDFEIDFSKIPQ